MKTGFVGIVIGFTVLLGGIIYLKNDAGIIQSGYLPCNEPLTYRIGSIDDRFGITEVELKKLMEEVSVLWSEATGNSAIHYHESGAINVNLIYAEQQLLTDSERQFRDRLSAEEQSISVAEREYQQLNQTFNEMESEYREDSNRLQNEIEALNSWVNRMNNEGGFSERDVEIFESRKQEIDQKTTELNRRAVQLQQAAERLNRTIDQLNRRIDQKNILVNEYNQTFTGTNRFTQGAYENIGNQKRINIYQFSDHDELRLVIAHEVGHALGVGHVENPKSIMYHLMGNQNIQGLRLTPEDIDALKVLCGQ
jgi:methyl-accepting chemotaxis protein